MRKVALASLALHFLLAAVLIPVLWMKTALDRHTGWGAPSDVYYLSRSRLLLENTAIFNHFESLARDQGATLTGFRIRTLESTGTVTAWVHPSFPAIFGGNLRIGTECEAGPGRADVKPAAWPRAPFPLPVTSWMRFGCEAEAGVAHLLKAPQGYPGPTDGFLLYAPQGRAFADWFAAQLSAAMSAENARIAQRGGGLIGDSVSAVHYSNLFDARYSRGLRRFFQIATACGAALMASILLMWSLALFACGRDRALRLLLGANQGLLLRDALVPYATSVIAAVALGAVFSYTVAGPALAAFDWLPIHDVPLPHLAGFCVALFLASTLLYLPVAVYFVWSGNSGTHGLYRFTQRLALACLSVTCVLFLVLQGQVRSDLSSLLRSYASSRISLAGDLPVALHTKLTTQGDHTAPRDPVKITYLPNGRIDGRYLATAGAAPAMLQVIHADWPALQALRIVPPSSGDTARADWPSGPAILLNRRAFDKLCAGRQDACTVRLPDAERRVLPYAPEGVAETTTAGEAYAAFLPFREDAPAFYMVAATPSQALGYRIEQTSLRNLYRTETRNMQLQATVLGGLLLIVLIASLAGTLFWIEFENRTQSHSNAVRFALGAPLWQASAVTVRRIFVSIGLGAAIVAIAGASASIWIDSLGYALGIAAFAGTAAYVRAVRASTGIACVLARESHRPF